MSMSFVYQSDPFLRVQEEHALTFVVAVLPLREYDAPYVLRFGNHIGRQTVSLGD